MVGASQGLRQTEGYYHDHPAFQRECHNVTNSQCVMKPGKFIVFKDSRRPIPQIWHVSGYTQ